MSSEILVLGAGMVGVSTALHLQARGHRVVLVDRKAPGRETSYGNAGLIQSEAVEPYAFPRDWRTLAEVARRRAVHAHYHAGALPGLLPRLASYWHWSAPARYAAIVQAWQRLIALAQPEHAALIDAAGAQDLVRPTGYLQAFRNAGPMAEGVARAERLRLEHGIRSAVHDGVALAAAEPGLRRPMAGAVHWLDPWSVADPGALVERYGGPMQVSIAFAEAQAERMRYPYAVERSIRREVFTRRGGLYFGTAHLLAYEAPYDRMLYRFADFNAGRWASRNAAFQQAVGVVTGLKLALDGDLLPGSPGADGATPGETERAAYTLAGRLGLDEAAIRRDLARGDE